MAHFVPLENGAQVEVIFDLGGQIVENRLWFVSRQPPIDQTQLDNLTFGVAAWHTSEVLPLLSEHLFCLSVNATDWSAQPAPYVSTTAVGLSGGTLGECHSANVAIRIAWIGDSGGKFRRNSNFVPGIPTSVLALNTIDPTWADNLRLAYVDLIDLAELMGPFPAWTWVSTSMWLAGALRTSQQHSRVDFPYLPSPYSTQRRKRLPPSTPY